MDQVRATHYTVVEDAVIDDEQLSAHGLLCYMAIRRHVNADGIAWPSRSRVAKLMRCSVRKVAEALLELQEAGYLEVASGAAEGKSNVYTLMNYRVERDPRQEVPRGQAGGAHPPRQEVPTEVSPVEVPPMKDLPSPSAPVSAPKKRPSFWKDLAELTVTRGGPWPAGTKEAVSLDRLITWGKKKAPEGTERFLRDFLDGAWALFSGKSAGMSEHDKAFWTSQPYTPSRLLTNAMAICAVLGKFEKMSTVQPRFAGRVCAKCGTMNKHSGSMCLKCNEDLPRRTA